MQQYPKFQSNNVYGYQRPMSPPPPGSPTVQISSPLINIPCSLGFEQSNPMHIIPQPQPPNHNDVEDSHPHLSTHQSHHQHQHQQMTTLILDNMDIDDLTSIPSGVRVCSLNRNYLKTLHERVFNGSWHSLRLLSLRGNQLSSIAGVFMCTRLEKVDLRGNKLEAHALSGLRALSCLDSLDLAGNQIHDIEPISSALSSSSLRYLDISNNVASNLFSHLCIPSLEILVASQVNATVLTFSHVHYKLHTIDARGSRIVSLAGLSEYLPALENLTLDETNLHVDDGKGISSFKDFNHLKLEKLSCRGSVNPFVPSNAGVDKVNFSKGGLSLADLPKLNELDWSQTRLTRVPILNTILPSLKRLTLKENDIECIPFVDFLSSMPNLQVLNLESNLLGSLALLPSGFKLPPKISNSNQNVVHNELHTLILSNNRLSDIFSLAQVLTYLPSLTHLDLRNNRVSNGVYPTAFFQALPQDTWNASYVLDDLISHIDNRLHQLDSKTNNSFRHQLDSCISYRQSVLSASHRLATLDGVRVSKSERESMLKSLEFDTKNHEEDKNRSDEVKIVVDRPKSGNACLVRMTTNSVSIAQQNEQRRRHGDHLNISVTGKFDQQQVITQTVENEEVHDSVSVILDGHQDQISARESFITNDHYPIVGENNNHSVNSYRRNVRIEEKNPLPRSTMHHRSPSRSPTQTQTRTNNHIDNENAHSPIAQTVIRMAQSPERSFSPAMSTKLLINERVTGSGEQLTHMLLERINELQKQLDHVQQQQQQQSQQEQQHKCDDPVVDSTPYITARCGTASVLDTNTNRRGGVYEDQHSTAFTNMHEEQGNMSRRSAVVSQSPMRTQHIPQEQIAEHLHAQPSQYENQQALSISLQSTAVKSKNKRKSSTQSTLKQKLLMQKQLIAMQKRILAQQQELKTLHRQSVDANIVSTTSKFDSNTNNAYEENIPQQTEKTVLEAPTPLNQTDMHNNFENSTPLQQTDSINAHTSVADTSAVPYQPQVGGTNGSGLTYSHRLDTLEELIPSAQTVPYLSEGVDGVAIDANDSISHCVKYPHTVAAFENGSSFNNINLHDFNEGQNDETTSVQVEIKDDCAWPSPNTGPLMLRTGGGTFSTLLAATRQENRMPEVYSLNDSFKSQCSGALNESFAERVQQQQQQQQRQKHQNQNVNPVASLPSTTMNQPVIAEPRTMAELLSFVRENRTMIDSLLDNEAENGTAILDQSIDNFRGEVYNKKMHDQDIAAINEHHCSSNDRDLMPQITDSINTIKTTTAQVANNANMTLKTKTTPQLQDFDGHDESVTIRTEHPPQRSPIKNANRDGNNVIADLVAINEGSSTFVQRLQRADPSSPCTVVSQQSVSNNNAKTVTINDGGDGHRPSVRSLSVSQYLPRTEVMTSEMKNPANFDSMKPVGMIHRRTMSSMNNETDGGVEYENSLHMDQETNHILATTSDLLRDINSYFQHSTQKQPSSQCEKPDEFLNRDTTDAHKHNSPSTHHTQSPLHEPVSLSPSQPQTQPQPVSSHHYEESQPFSSMKRITIQNISNNNNSYFPILPEPMPYQPQPSQSRALPATTHIVLQSEARAPSSQIYPTHTVSQVSNPQPFIEPLNLQPSFSNFEDRHRRPIESTLHWSQHTQNILQRTNYHRPNNITSPVSHSAIANAASTRAASPHRVGRVPPSIVTRLSPTFDFHRRRNLDLATQATHAAHAARLAALDSSRQHHSPSSSGLSASLGGLSSTSPQNSSFFGSPSSYTSSLFTSGSPDVTLQRHLSPLVRIQVSSQPNHTNNA